MLEDQIERSRALDGRYSFIVHAPAGSGKTELLVQRYLVVLAKSATPEAVLALTFTRKAAEEMRQRIIATLEFAISHKKPPEESYAYQRWLLGKELYEWQAQKKWDLLNNLHRLQIKTIDAFYAQIVRTSASVAQEIGTAQIIEDPESLYHEAITLLLAELESDSPLGKALAYLVGYLNNDSFQLERLLVYLLERRDQWLSIVPENIDALSPLRQLLEEGLFKVREAAYHDANTVFQNCGKPHCTQSLSDLAEAAQSVSSITHSKSTLTVSHWETLARLLLTTQGQWRRITSSQFFAHHEKTTQKLLNQALKEWLALLHSQEAPRLALLTIRDLPPLQYTEDQWVLLNHLFYILNALIAILDIVFQQHHQADYIAIALAARRLLGAPGNPSDLLLRMDYQLQHILVDEMQDTSIAQLNFLEQLIEGWQLGDGRTLFLVGDPMQSIYRFRRAESYLFGQIKEKGIGSLSLRSITLSTNFRSNTALIRWTNDHFSAITSKQQHFYQENLFTLSAPKGSSYDCGTQSIQMHWLPDACILEEAAHVVAQIQSIVDSEHVENNSAKSPSIAVLGRARQHLVPILDKLRALNIPYQAVDIETLADRPVIQDLLVLTRALTHLGDDIAWFALLRGPWCGLLLSDLHILSQASQSTCPPRLVWEQINQLDHLSLSYDAKARLTRLVNVLTPIIASDGRIALSKRVMQAWCCLGGLVTHTSPTWDMKEVVLFCQCVNDVQENEMIIDSRVLEAKLNKTYLSSTTAHAGSRVTLMTIHKAKGLEFDIVMLPGLHRSIRSATHPLILFQEVPVCDTRSLLLAPIKGSDQEAPDALYAYLQKINSQQDWAETIRLLYVGCTRAKHQLHLIGSLSFNEEKTIKMPCSGSFLQILWPVLKAHQKQVSQSKHSILPATKIRWLKRMTLDSIISGHK